MSTISWINDYLIHVDKLQFGRLDGTVQELQRELCHLHLCSPCTPEAFSTILVNAIYRNTLTILRLLVVLVVGGKRSTEHYWVTGLAWEDSSASKCE